MNGPRIVGVGHVSLDHRFGVVAALRLGGKTPAQSYRALVGGMTANALVAVARLGGQAHIVSPVGDDLAAAQFAAHFASEGVGTQGLTRVAGAHSSVSAVLIDDKGGRTIVNHRGSALQLCPPLDTQALAGAAALLSDPRCPSWAEAALRQARRVGMVSVFDGDTAPREDLRRLAGLSQWAVFSTPGLAAFSEAQAPQALHEALAAGAQRAVVTLDDAGLLWCSREQPQPRRMAAFAVSPVRDTTAAGDVFHGALALALAEGAHDEAALRFASAAAALKCRHGDGALGAPRRREVEELLSAQAQV